MVEVIKPLVADQNGFWHSAFRQWRVIYALMLRSIRTRFLGHGVGYLIKLAWPLVHILIIVLIFDFTGRLAPYGTSRILFVSTGAVPFMIFMYISRFMMYTVTFNKPMLAFPGVHVLDVMFAGAILEILSMAVVVILLAIIAVSFGVDIEPRNMLELTAAVGTAILLGMGFGLLNGVICLAFPMWITGYALVSLTMWAASGVFFVPDALPNFVRVPLSYNPILQVIEWTRAAYYEGYGNVVLDRAYAVKVALTSVCLGLLVERASRGRILMLR